MPTESSASLHPLPLQLQRKLTVMQTQSEVWFWKIASNNTVTWPMAVWNPERVLRRGEWPLSVFVVVEGAVRISYGSLSGLSLALCPLRTHLVQQLWQTWHNLEAIKSQHVYSYHPSPHKHPHKHGKIWGIHFQLILEINAFDAKFEGPIWFPSHSWPVLSCNTGLQKNVQALDLSPVDFLRQAVSLLLRLLVMQGVGGNLKGGQEWKWATSTAT